MQAIVYNITGSEFNRSMEAAALRAAYLLGARPVITGDTGNDIYFTKNISRLSVLQKLEFLAGFHKNEADTHAIFTDMLTKMKEVAGVKPKTNEQRAARKSMEKSVDTCFINLVENIQTVIDNYGFGVIRELKDDKIFGYFPMNSEPETAAHNYEIIASDLMQLLVVEDDDTALGGIYNSPELFFFGNEFLTDAYAKPPVLSVQDAEAGNPAAIYLDQGFRFPPINELTATEMQTVRKQLHVGSHPFNEAVDEWCYRCYDKEAIYDRIFAFRDRVLPAAGMLQQALNNNETLQRCRQQHSHLPDIEVWMGELPVLQLWQYYRDFKVLQDETWQKLQEIAEEPDFKDQRWPVMMLKTNETTPKESLEPGEKAEEILPTKKYLSID